MFMNAESCTNPGYTRRPAPAWPNGTRLIRWRSNHSIGCEVASVLTSVGLIRQSIGPAISTRLAGVAGWLSSDISATAHSAETQGWQMAIRCAPEPIASRNWMTCAVYSSRPKRPAASGTSRTLCQSVM